MKNIDKRILTSILLLFILYLAYISQIFLLILIFFVFLQIFDEFFNIFKKIYFKNKLKLFFVLFFILFYLTYFFKDIWISLSTKNNNELYFFLIVTICISTDIGGYVFGKLFKGKKLTNISPNKTFSGMYGSFIFSIFFTVLIFKDQLSIQYIVLFSFFISLFSQIGDIFISFLKRKVKIKDTGNILPGHGGLLDRFDGIIVAMPLGFLILNNLWKKK